MTLEVGQFSMQLVGSVSVQFNTQTYDRVLRTPSVPMRPRSTSGPAVTDNSPTSVVLRPPYGEALNASMSDDAKPDG